ncbi:hypothetical protein N5C46_09065 [Rossellomorea vietnamensis]|uniref:Uncharacterized protein n=1 Tax=Rossellomorea vietnamensis TaxID=218284 RepID=A0ACD4CCG3_9BACI|nr:hypothetical protein [Rossellomorea vietnamensis]UXH46177.1 hypothetical protein N5C46_09065 [Rossellomorea vietnamensis]
MNNLFFLPIGIGVWIEKRVGTGVRGIIGYLIIYMIITFGFSLITDGIGSTFINRMFYFFNTYLCLGMLYVIFHYWKRNERND